MEKFIYSRVSTVEQNVEQQTKLLREAYPDVSEVFEDKFSGKEVDRPELNRLKDKVRKGDIVYCYDVSRLARNTKDAIELVEFFTDKGVSLVVHKLDNTDIASGTGKLMFTMLAAFAEMERTNMLEKQAIGIERAKAEGKYRGKKVSPDTIAKCKEALELVEKMKYSKKKAASQVGIGVSTFYKWLAERNR